MKTALVLSAGGGFGAYQAGAWRVLSERLQPGLVVGASIGSLNACAIAGGMNPDELCDFWRTMDVSAELKFRLASPRRGFVDGAILERVARQLHARYPARAELGVVTTQLLPFQRRLFRGAEITWEHLYASCAIPLVFAPRRLAGAWHYDGGLIETLPLWAAREMGATHIVAVDVWHLGLQRFRRPRRPAPGLSILAPSEALGSARESLFWTRSHVDRWMALGEQDALRLDLSGIPVKNISIQECFERQ
jgi:NTE family protein